MIHLSVKLKYGLSAMLELATAFQKGPIQSRLLAERQNVPQNYLEHILMALKKGELVISHRGSHGGYGLRRAPEDVTVMDIFTCLEGPLELATNNTGCETLTHYWKEVEKALAAPLSTTLHDLVQKKQQSDKTITYSI